ncbi:MAG: ATP-dependent RecD-like DNA helicase [Candidatus Omnitrophota bacterium]
MASFKVKIQKKIFFNEENGYSVCKALVHGHRESVVIVGNLFHSNEGDSLEIEGDRITHPKFGEQIKITSAKPLLPQDRDGIIKYLSDHIEGIGKRTAERIVDRFGENTFEILEKKPERLREVRGIKKSAAEDIKQNIAENKTIRELTVKMAPYGVGPETIFKIYKEFKENSLTVLQENPFILIDRIKGVGFKIADTIARGFGLAANDIFRIQAGIEFLLAFDEQRNGDLYAPEESLITRAARLLNVGTEDVTVCIRRMVQDRQLIREEIPEPVLMSVKNFSIEKAIAHSLNHLSRSASGLEPVAIDFDYIFKRTAVNLTDEQRQAVVSAVNNRMSIITGGPGTGKTTIIRAIIESLEKDGKQVLIAAPTGRAAKRIEEATLYQGSTIHRLLKISPDSGRFVHNDQNPLKADAIIVDEFSMVDFFIFYSLLKAISQHTRLIIIGDKDQLPSVGPGNVLRDMIHSGYFHIIYLNRNFRQNQDSLIIENAYRINNGEDLIVKPYSDHLDFVFLHVTSERQALEKVLRIIDYHKNDYNFNSPDYQVLAPMYRGDSGIDQLNLRIQEKFNAEPDLIKREKFAFKRWDKVMQLKNNYEKEIFNGEQGIVTDFNSDKKIMMVDFDGTFVEYTPAEMDELTLSYAVSVHKAQGSEYSMLILLLMPGHAIMLNRELLYTAVTRAKKKIFLLSDPETIRRAVLNSTPSERKTLLIRRLKDAFEKRSLFS